IPYDAQSRIFKPFMQADSSTSRHYGGTGIGLSISQRLVELMGGSMTFTSIPDVGTTFKFDVYLEKEEKLPCQSKAPASMMPISQQRLPEEASRLAGLVALIVDDRPVRQLVTSTYLRRLGMDVEIAATVEQAVDTVQRLGVARGGSMGSGGITPGTKSSTGISVVLVDCNASMWTQSGFEVAEALASIDSGIAIPAGHGNASPGKVVAGPFPAVPIIFITKKPDPVLEPKVKKTASAMIVLKPLRRASLCMALIQVIGLVTNAGGKLRGGSGKMGLSMAIKALLKGKKFLVCDDNMVNRRVASKMLEKYGGETVCVESGLKALDVMRNPDHGIDMVLMDVQVRYGGEIGRLAQVGYGREIGRLVQVQHDRQVGGVGGFRNGRKIGNRPGLRGCVQIWCAA
ncbi:hypothetical protein CBR_g74916, partial [Chara braunii]